MGQDTTGRVVAVESSYYDGLNDVWTMVWNPETLAVEYGAGVGGPEPKVDAPAWVVAFYTIAKAVARQEAAAERAHAAARAASYDEAIRPSRGKLVQVVRGRKVPKGSVGTVFWLGENKWGWSVGIELPSGERVFTSTGNVEVLEGPAMPFIGANRKAA